MNTFRHPRSARLRFRHLELVRELARTGSLRAAAQSLHQTQSALSKALKEAEAMLECALFERTRRGVQLTPEGTIVARGAGLLLAELDHLKQEAAAARGRAEAVLRVGATPYLALTLLPGVLGRLLQRELPVHVRLTEERVPKLHEVLLSGGLDAILTTYSSEPASLAGGGELRYEKLFDAGLAVIAPASHASARRARCTWKQLAQEPWILPGAASFVRRLVDETFLREGLNPPVPAIESVSPFTNIALVAAGLGLSVVPTPGLEPPGRGTGVRKLRVSPPFPPLPVVLVTRSTGGANPRVALLREALELPAGDAADAQLERSTKGNF